MTTITVNLRCLNVDTDGVTPIRENGRRIVTVEKKRRPAIQFCPKSIALGGRDVQYRARSTSNDWMVPDRCPCHKLIILW